MCFETDAKENDKASALRSKHSVTEQRRRSKINERFCLIPLVGADLVSFRFRSTRRLFFFFDMQILRSRP